MWCELRFFKLFGFGSLCLGLGLFTCVERPGWQMCGAWRRGSLARPNTDVTLGIRVTELRSSSIPLFSAISGSPRRIETKNRGLVGLTWDGRAFV